MKYILNDKTKPEEPRHGTETGTSKEYINYTQKNTTNKKQNEPTRRGINNKWTGGWPVSRKIVYIQSLSPTRKVRKPRGDLASDGMWWLIDLDR